MNLLMNKTINRSYEVLDTLEAGMKLAGWEVKTLRKQHGSIKEAYITVNDEIWLVNAHIPAYQPNQKQYEGIDPYQNRKLLLHQEQIEKIKDSQKQKGLTIVPIRIYEKGKLIKIEIAIARGKKLHDKRSDMKNKTTKREAERAMKGQY